MRSDRSNGQALVELALVIPIFLVLLFGLFDVGRVVYINNALSEGSREGSRYGSVASRANSATGRSQIGTWTASKLTAVPAPDVSVTCQREGSAVSSCHSGDVLIVRITSDVDMMTPVIGQLVGSLSLVAESRVRVQQ